MPLLNLLSHMSEEAKSRSGAVLEMVAQILLYCGNRHDV